MSKTLSRLGYHKLLVAGFGIVITIGAILLMLPISSKDGVSVSAVDAFFTATSATCVTGLIVYDTYTQWSLFGQLVILGLIQVGGLGFMTFICLLSMLLKRKIGLGERRMLVQSSGNMQLSGVTKMIRNIFLGTIIFETLGAVILAIRFCPVMGIQSGIYCGIFHSVSAFCNAGFDILGRYGEFGSLTTFADDKVILLTISALIIIGGIGFPVWNDVLKKGIRIRKYELHSKLALITTVILILFGFGWFFLLEYSNTLSDMSIGDRITNALFQSVTTRTAGFNSIDQNAMTESGFVLTLLYMFIGGSPASTAGGIKTTTIAAAVLCAITSIRNKEDINVFKKQLDKSIAVQAFSIITIYAFSVMFCSCALSMIEQIPFKNIIYEVISAVGTVGLSTGVIPDLSSASKIILLFLMFFGRIGGLSLFMAMGEKRKKVSLERPTERILIG